MKRSNMEVFMNSPWYTTSIKCSMCCYVWHIHRLSLRILAYVCRLKPSFNRSLFKLTISDQTLIKLKLYLHLNGQQFIVVLEQFSLLQSFGVKMQKSTFLREKGFERSFFNEVFVITNWSTRLEKH